MAVTNHLKTQQERDGTLAIAFGRAVSDGHGVFSRVEGASPNHRIHGLTALGEGEWESIEAVYFKGKPVTAVDYEFNPGKLSTGMNDPNQRVLPMFPKDVPHSRTATLAWRAPAGVGDADTEKTSPHSDLRVIARTKKCPNFNSAGVQTDFSYTTSPAREVVELARSVARLPNLPARFASWLNYWISRIDWGAWVAWRDYCAALETVDYRTIPDLEGFGLTGAYYNGADFETYLSERVDPIISLDLTHGSLAYGQNTDYFSVRWTGFIKFPHAGNWTLSLEHDDGVRLSVNNQQLLNEWQSLGTHSATFTAAAANTFYPIMIEWHEITAQCYIKFRWSHAQQAQEIVPSKFLYPAVAQAERYPVTIDFSQPTTFMNAVREMLRCSNSLVRDVGGKLRFFCYEQLAPELTFSVANGSIEEGTFDFDRTTYLTRERRNHWTAEMRDADSRFLSPMTKPPIFELADEKQKSGRTIAGASVQLYTNTRWRARKLLKTAALLESTKGLNVTFSAPNARVYFIMPGALVRVSHRKLGANPKLMLVRDVIKTTQSSNDEDQPDVEKRRFTLQEWNN